MINSSPGIVLKSFEGKLERPAGLQGLQTSGGSDKLTQ